MSTNNVYRVVFKADLSDNAFGRVAQKLGAHGGDLVWAANVEIIPGYSTFDSIPNILSIAYPGLKDFAPIYADDSEGQTHWL